MNIVEWFEQLLLFGLHVPLMMNVLLKQTLVIFDGHSHYFVWFLCLYCFIPCTFLPDSGTKFSGPSFSSDSSVTIDDGTFVVLSSVICHRRVITSL